ncbi:PREDICTED: uncharacterized protein LOC106816588 [Priapulus caudatus]|uniref:Uncharacterized protein LOC106816588 n=1 Tax=Priapulus caudatus TaxID=37621 RepID=A0ABM1EWX4_PRICU|nr:PREDICTED: uncharacterized protein LOC106816588 [Priapulus caudatus]
MYQPAYNLRSNPAGEITTTADSSPHATPGRQNDGQVHDSWYTSTIAMPGVLQIEKFKGSGQDVVDWMATYETLAALIYKDSALAMLPTHLQDPARAWFMKQPAAKKTTMTAVRELFVTRFQRPKEIDLGVLTAVQQPSESVQDYIIRLESKFEPALPEQYKVAIALNGLNQAHQIYLRQHNPQSLEVLVKLAHNLPATTTPFVQPANTGQVASVQDSLRKEIDDLRHLVQNLVVSHHEIASAAPDSERQHQQRRNFNHRRHSPARQHQQQRYDQHGNTQTPGSYRRRDANFNTDPWNFRSILAWIVLVLGTIAPVGMASEDLIFCVNYGIIMEAKGELHFSPDSWLHTVRIQLPSTAPRVQPFVCADASAKCSALRAMALREVVLRKDVTNTVHTLQSWVTEIIPKPREQHRRRSRSLLPFIGDISSLLFGTATPADLQRVATHVNSLIAHIRVRQAK